MSKLFAVGDRYARLVLRPEEWESLPADWEAIFGRSAPLAVEVGFGNGEFLAQVAAEHPHWSFIGFEVTLKCVENAARRMEQRALENVRLMRLEGRFGLRELFAEGSVNQVYVNFPCPWPKARHAQRRLFGPECVHTLAAVLLVGGEVRLVTDVHWYACEAREALQADGMFAAVGPRRVVDNGPATRYERKWRLEGREIWELRGECRAAPAIQRIAEGVMPHARVEREVPWAGVKRLAGWTQTWSGGAFVVREVFYRADERSAILRVFSTDGDFQQQYFMLLARARYGMLVKLDGATLPFRTPAVKRSVADVAAVLREGGT
ncbi:MAG: tRNA (guanosine(46)-N7)-methyltransferase TrmB [Candidatus Bipolaricaulota bacterium]